MAGRSVYTISTREEAEGFWTAVLEREVYPRERGRIARSSGRTEHEAIANVAIAYNNALESERLDARPMEA